MTAQTENLEGLRTSGSVEIMTIGGDAIQRLGEAGLSPLVLLELTTSLESLSDDTVQALRFASGLLLLADSLDQIAVQPVVTADSDADATVVDLPVQSSGFEDVKDRSTSDDDSAADPDPQKDTSTVIAEEQPLVPATDLSKREVQMLNRIVGGFQPGERFRRADVDFSGIEFRTQTAKDQAFSKFTEKMVAQGILVSEGEKGGRKYYYDGEPVATNIEEAAQPATEESGLVEEESIVEPAELAGADSAAEEFQTEDVPTTEEDAPAAPIFGLSSREMQMLNIIVGKFRPGERFARKDVDLSELDFASKNASDAAFGKFAGKLVDQGILTSEGEKRGRKYHYASELVIPGEDPDSTPPARRQVQRTEYVEPAEGIDLDNIGEFCEQYWCDDDSVSLEYLLENKLDQGDTAVRDHIAALLDKYAPDQDDNDLLTRNEWKTLSLLSGYKLDPGWHRLSWSMVEVRMRLDYDQTGEDRDEAFISALTKLINAAAEDYKAGWYPGDEEPEAAEQSDLAAQDDADRHSDEAQANEDAPTDSKTELDKAFELLVKQGNLTPGYVEPLVAHMTGTRKIIPTERRVVSQGLSVISRLAHEAQIRAREQSLDPHHDRRADLQPKEKQLLAWLVGDSSAGTSGKTYDELMASVTLRRLGFQPETLKEDIIKAVTKVIKLSA